MRKTFSVLVLTFVFVCVLDVVVAAALHWADAHKRLSSLVQYFEYGRSVPGKLDLWEREPNLSGNLYDVAWRPEVVAKSQQAFEEEKITSRPVIRSYGMSFVNNILVRVTNVDPELAWDGHSGPGAPPNYTFALFQEDRGARRPGDIVVLGILSSSVPGMAALSNRTWVFEQPAPFTYPIFWPDKTGLRRVDPIVQSAQDERSLTGQARRAWDTQLRQEDQFYGPQAFGLAWLDRSPFARLARRSLATSDIQKTQASILAGNYPYAEVLRRMVGEFARIAREDGQIPIVMLIQTRGPADPDVLDIVKPVLRDQDIKYFATKEHFDPRDVSGFSGDGHYVPKVDRLFAERFVDLIKAD